MCLWTLNIKQRANSFEIDGKFRRMMQTDEEMKIQLWIWIEKHKKYQKKMTNFNKKIHDMNA